MKKKSVTFLTAILLLGIGGNTFAADTTVATDTKAVTTTTVATDTKATTDEKSEKFKISGVFGTRYDHTEGQGVTDFGNVLGLKISAKLNDKISIMTESEMHHNLRDDLPFDFSPDGKLNDWTWLGLQAHVKGEFDGTTVKLGRFSYVPTYGLVHGDKQQVDGGLVSFGKIVKTTIVTGTNNPFWPATTSNSTLNDADGIMQKSSYHAIDFVVPVSKITNIRASYQKGTVPLPREVASSNPQLSFTEYGFDTNFAKDLSFECAQVRSTADSANNGSYAKLTYKGANPGKLHSYDVYTAYHDLEANSIIGNDINFTADQKGMRYGIHYVPWNNSLLHVWYDDVKVSSTNTTKDKFRAQMDFFY